MDLLYLTDRAPENSDQSELNYGWKRLSLRAFGSAVVEIGGGLPWTQLVLASESKQRNSSLSVTVISRAELGRFPEAPYPFSVVDGMLVNDERVQDEHNRIAVDFRDELDRRLAMADDKTI